MNVKSVIPWRERYKPEIISDTLQMDIDTFNEWLDADEGLPVSYMMNGDEIAEEVEWRWRKMTKSRKIAKEDRDW